MRFCGAKVAILGRKRVLRGKKITEMTYFSYKNFAISASLATFVASKGLILDIIVQKSYFLFTLFII